MPSGGANVNMHIAVWIITPITTPRELGIAFQKGVIYEIAHPR